VARDDQTAVRRKAGAKPGATGRGTNGRAARGERPGPERMRELVALVLFGVAVFLIFCLVATAKAGLVGRGVEAGLVFAFGRLAFVLPLACLAVGITVIAGMKVQRSYRFLGAMVFLVGLFLLMGGAVPPFGSHGSELFVRARFEGRAGGLGEAFYAAVHGLVGIVGVGIIGWILVLSGFSLASSVSARMLGRRTRTAARAVKDSAERATLRTRRRDQDARAAQSDDWNGMGSALDAAAWQFPGPSGEADTLRAGDALHGVAGVRGASPLLGPVDLVARASGEVAGSHGSSRGVFGDAFDDWARAQPAYHSFAAPVETADAAPGNPSGVLDGAQVYADIFGASGGPGLVDVPSGGQGEAARRAPTAAQGVGGADVKSRSTVTSEAPRSGGTNASEEDGDPTAESAGDHAQESLPGLGRQPRQIELAVTEPTYVLPQADMLRKSTPPSATAGSGDRDTSAVLLQALGQFGVQARVIGMVVGPRVTRYELHLAPGTKVGKVSALKDDLAYALATTEIRILAPIPGKSAVGVEVPNQRPDFVTLGDIYREFPRSAGPLMVWLGKDISGKAVYADLTRLPHLLIAGTTGSGKSGCVNCLVSSILLRSTPEQVRMIMVDPKKVELSHYDRIPHLLVPVVTNMKDAAGVLHNVVKEMEDRYELMELDHARSLAEMNKTRARRGERPVPYILIVIDELADLMMTSPQEVEDYVIRLAQKARAVGIHLVVATQRPSADVITGMIKANIPSRIAFAVSSQTDSRVILDVNGAETLLGMGDMLFKPLGSSHLQRVQGAYITEEEIALLVNHWRHQAEPEFREELLRRPPDGKKGDRGEDELFDPDSDDLLADAAQLVIETGSASVSMLQRRLRVGYTRAGRLIDMLERRGIVGPWEGSKPRQILVEPDDFDHVLATLRADEHGGDGEDFD
jgi:S-DNA-T family DNA segregation ATPase FtsK/SpoIIIE